jgi:hypothetical protein
VGYEGLPAEPWWHAWYLKSLETANIEGIPPHQSQSVVSRNKHTIERGLARDCKNLEKDL